MKFGYEELVQISEQCVSGQTLDPQELLLWLDSIDVDRDAFSQMGKVAGSAALIAARAAKAADVPAEAFLNAVWASGFELGVRVQQARELVV